MTKRIHWINPIVKHRADPCIYRHTDGYYYFVATVPEYDRIEISRSVEISELGNTVPIVIWHQHNKGEMSNHIWAPELHFIEGVWYLYFAAAHSEDPWKLRMYVLQCNEANPITGKWTERGQIKSRWDTFCLDATVFEYGENLYMIWAQKDPNIEGNSNLYIDIMKNPWTLSGNQILLSTPEYSWEKQGFRVNEGPSVLKTDEMLFVTYSASKTDENYCMGLLSLKNGGNPLDLNHWEKSPKPVFETNEKNSIYGPGHNTFTTTSDGKSILMAYHAREYKEIEGDPLDDPNRHTYVKPIVISKGQLILGSPAPTGVIQEVYV